MPGIELDFDMEDFLSNQSIQSRPEAELRE
jgi:hypothetical protein